MKINAETLAQIGWTQAQIDRYYKLLNRKQQFGYGSLSSNDRCFLRSAHTAIDNFEKARQADLVAATKRRASGVQPVETKLHYRWLTATREEYARQTELRPNEVSAQVIVHDEMLRALEKFQPLLDQVDTSKRNKIDNPVADLVALAASFDGARSASFDHNQLQDTLRSQFPDSWNDRWYQATDNLWSNVVIRDTDELEFRSLVREQIEFLTRTVYPSVAGRGSSVAA